MCEINFDTAQLYTLFFIVQYTCVRMPDFSILNYIYMTVRSSKQTCNVIPACIMVPIIQILRDRQIHV